MRNSATQPPVTPDVTQPGTVGVQVCGTFMPARACRQLPPGPVTQTNVGDGWAGSVVGTPEPAVDGSDAGDVGGWVAGDVGGCCAGDVGGCEAGEVDGGCDAGDVDGGVAVDGCVPTVVA